MNGSLPHLSVIIPAYNAEATIADCIQSMLDQNYPRASFEVIVVDNLSTDKTAEIVKTFPVRYICENHQQGPSPARNSGACVARGSILVFFDADQVATPSYLKELIQGHEDSENAAFASLNIGEDSHNSYIGAYWKNEWEHNSKNFRGSRYLRFSGGNVAIRREIFQKTGGFDTSLKTCEDIDLALRIQKSTKLKVRYNHNAVSYHKERSSGVSLIEREFRFGIGSFCLGRRHKEFAEPLYAEIYKVLRRTIMGMLAVLKKICECLLKKTKWQNCLLILLDVVMRWTNLLGKIYAKFFTKPDYTVAILSSGLGHIHRGVEGWSQDLSHALYDRGVQITLYKGSGKKKHPYEKVIGCWKRKSPLSKLLLKLRPQCLWHFGLSSSYTLEQMTFVWNLLPELVFHQYDIIHTKDPQSADILKKLSKWKLVSSKIILAHGTEEPFAFINNFDYIQHLAPHHFQEAEHHCPGYKPGWFMIPNFVNTEIFNKRDKKALRRKFQIPEKAFVVLCVAAIKNTHKRLQYLIDEIEFLKMNELPEIFLLIGGSTTAESDDVMQYGTSRLNGQIKFLTNVSHDEMTDVYNVADAFTLCSLKEMLGTVLLEAQAVGLPCLAHHYPVMEWVVKENGECLDMTKKGALSLCLTKYFDKDYYQMKSQKARDHVVNEFSHQPRLSV